MLTTTIDSPQHKRVLWIRNRNSNSPLSIIHRTDKPSKDVITIKKAREIHLELINLPCKVRRFILQMEICTRTMHQLNIPMNLSKIIKTKFCQLNELLKGTLTTTIDSPQHKRVLWMRNRNSNSPLSIIHRTDKPSKDVITIKKVKEIHLELIKCARNINDAYALHMLFSISTAFFLITSTAYHIYYYLLTNSYRTNKSNFLIYLFWIFYFGIKIIIISHVCAETVMEIRDFTLQLIQNPLSFTIYGLVDLDYTLIRTVIGTVTTYLVILIQVGNVPPEFSATNSTLSSND
ncbi:gustatory and pheromone receptor 32a-like [Vespa crabro]|uniref:gustatory and pheromone receptor 32a-like n=1 Tax=Vespa crabro TaxID=7445 RepID=UPI001F01F59B|nr:gustatory and pheromone receptor 32a-like [Vespa crabro]